MAFGGNTAVDDVSLTVRKGEIVGLIGSNGAGKSTLMNAVGGFVTSSGSVRLENEEVGDKAPAHRAALGLGRTFQSATLFPELTVTETLLVAWGISVRVRCPLPSPCPERLDEAVVREQRWPI